MSREPAESHGINDIIWQERNLGMPKDHPAGKRQTQLQTELIWGVLLREGSGGRKKKDLQKDSGKERAGTGRACLLMGPFEY